MLIAFLRVTGSEIVFWDTNWDNLTVPGWSKGKERWDRKRMGLGTLVV